MTTVDLHVGLELGPSSWIEVPQGRIDAFAAATEDEQWIHVDPVRAADGPFGATIAHGYLTLSLLAPFTYELLPVTDRTVVNYGLNRVRFPGPVPVGSRLRAVYRIDAIDPVDGGRQLLVTATVERDGAERPVCVAEMLFRIID